MYLDYQLYQLIYECGTIRIIIVDKYSSSQLEWSIWSSWYLQFYYSWIQYELYNDSISWVGNTVAISGTNIALDWKVWCSINLRIPVWTNMY